MKILAQVSAIVVGHTVSREVGWRLHCEVRIRDGNTMEFKYIKYASQRSWEDSCSTEKSQEESYSTEKVKYFNTSHPPVKAKKTFIIKILA